jgi:pantetheine-phosphate adenylyltransferase
MSNPSTPTRPPTIAVFPGSFDPLTIGHVSIVERALPLFDRVVVGVGANSTKRAMFDAGQRLAWVREAFAMHPQVEAVLYDGLTADLCRKMGATFILRGLRNSTDHGYERSIALINRAISGVDTLFLPSLPEHAHISSTIVRELIANNGDASPFVPPAVRLP